MLDPRHHAVRRDVADIRLADRVFAPHYAAPMPCRLARTAQMRASADGDEIVAVLGVGDLFEVLDIAGDDAWGVAVQAGLVGYLECEALGLGLR